MNDYELKKHFLNVNKKFLYIINVRQRSVANMTGFNDQMVLKRYFYLLLFLFYFLIARIYVVNDTERLKY